MLNYQRVVPYRFFPFLFGQFPFSVVLPIWSPDSQCLTKCFRSALELFNASKCSQAFPLVFINGFPKFFPLLPVQLSAMVRDALVQDDGAYIHHRFQARVGKRQPWQAIQCGAP